MRCEEAEGELNPLPSASHSGAVDQGGRSQAGVRGSLCTEQHGGDLCGDSSPTSAAQSLLAAAAGMACE